MVAVKHSGDEDRQGESAEKDEENAACHQNHRVGRPEVLALLDEHVREVTYLLGLEMAQVRVSVAERVHILVLQLFNFIGVLGYLLLQLLDTVVEAHNVAH